MNSYGFRGSAQADGIVRMGDLDLILNTTRREHEIAAMGSVFLEIFIGSSILAGIYKGMTDEGGHIIMPSTFPNGKKFSDDSLPTSERFVWMNQPSVHYNRLTGFRPIRRESLEAFASGFENVEHLGDYLNKNQSNNPEDSSVS